MKKDVFINRYKYVNLVEYQNVFIKTILDLKLYLVEFDLEKYIKKKIYPNDNQLRNINY